MKNRKPLPAIALIAGGSGDRELLSVRAAAMLDQAEVVVCDPEVAALLSGSDAEVLDLPTAPTDAAAVAKALVEQARAGRHAVRLFAGDPIADGRVIAEAKALHRSKVPFEILPSAADVSGIAAYAGIGLVGPKSKQVRVVNLLTSQLEEDALADATATLVVRHAADAAAGIAKAALAAGRTPTTPLVVVRGGTTVEQQTVVTTLGDAAADLKAAKVTGDGDVFLGEAVGSAGALGWFESRPLFGWRVLVPRTKDQAGDLSAQLRLYGAVPVEVPTISVEPPRTPQQMERAIEGIEAGRYQWIAFTSVNAVKAIRERFEQRGLDARHLAGLKIAAIGESTAEALRVRCARRPGTAGRAAVLGGTARRVAGSRSGTRPHRPGVPAPRRHRHGEAGRRSQRPRLGGRRHHGLPDRARRTAGRRDPGSDQDRRFRRCGLHLVQHGPQPGGHRG